MCRTGILQKDFSNPRDNPTRIAIISAFWTLPFRKVRNRKRKSFPDGINKSYLRIKNTAWSKKDPTKFSD